MPQRDILRNDTSYKITQDIPRDIARYLDITRFILLEMSTNCCYDAMISNFENKKCSIRPPPKKRCHVTSLPPHDGHLSTTAVHLCPQGGRCRDTFHCKSIWNNRWKCIVVSRIFNMLWILFSFRSPVLGIQGPAHFSRCLLLVEKTNKPRSQLKAAFTREYGC